MFISGSVLRGIIGTIYLLIISITTALTFFFYSEPVLFAFVITAVSLLVLSYPILCIFTVSRAYDLDIRGCQFEWIPVSKNLEAQTEKVRDEKPTKLDDAFIYAYM